MKAINILTILTLASILTIWSCGDSDDQAPTIRITLSPENMAISPGDTLMVNGTAADNEQLSSINLSIRDSELLIITSFDTPLSHNFGASVVIQSPIEDGQYTVTATVTDAEGNTAKDEENFTVEN